MSSHPPGKNRHPDNWLPSVRGQKRRKAQKNDVKLPKQTKIKVKNRLNGKCYFLDAVVIDLFSRYVATYSYVSLPSWVSIATTLRHTYSWIVSRKLRSEVMTLVTFSTMLPTSCLSWSMVMGRPIMEVRQVCRVTRLVATYHTISSCVIAIRGGCRNFKDT